MVKSRIYFPDNKEEKSYIKSNMKIPLQNFIKGQSVLFERTNSAM